MYEERLQSRMAGDRGLAARDRAIVKLANTYGYDYERAARMYEMMQVRQFETLFGSVFGAFAVYKVWPMQKELSASHPLFRKTWMKFPLLFGTFGAAYHIATLLPVKLFNKF